MEPQVHTWLIHDRLALAERPGGGGRSHRITRRTAELEWWKQQGIRTVVSTHPARTGLLDAALAGFAVEWHPLRSEDEAGASLQELAMAVGARLDDEQEAILVHCDRPGEWLTAVGAVLSAHLGCTDGPRDALADMRSRGLVVGSLAIRLVSTWEEGHASPPVPAHPAIASDG